MCELFPTEPIVCRSNRTYRRLRERKDILEDDKDRYDVRMVLRL